MPYTRRQMKRLLDPELIPAGEMSERARVAETVIKRGTFAVEDRAARQLWRLYRLARRDLDSQAREIAARLGIRRLEMNRAGKQWREAMGQVVEARLGRLAEASAALALRYATTAWYGGYYGRAWLLDVTTPADVRITTRQINKTEVARYLAQMVGIREDEYTDLINDLLGKDWRDLFKNELDDVTLKIKRAIWQGMEAGEGIPDIMGRVDEALGSYSKAGYSANFGRVQTITRTVVNRASNNGAIQVFRDNVDVLDGYQWLAAKDERVCPTCRSLNGTVYKLDDFYRPPAHNNCRCTIIPVLKAGVELPAGGNWPTLDDWLTGMGLGWWLDDWLDNGAAEDGGTYEYESVY